MAHLEAGRGVHTIIVILKTPDSITTPLQVQMYLDRDMRISNYQNEK